MVQERNNLDPQITPAMTPGCVRLELRIPPDSGELPAARHAVQRVCRDAGISCDECADLDLALGEALANAVVHGAKPHHCMQTPEVHISAWDYQSQLIVEVRDCGCGFDPPPPPYAMPAPEMDATHGRGLPLMELLTDAFAICRGDASEGGSSIFLIKAKPEMP